MSLVFELDDRCFILSNVTAKGLVIIAAAYEKIQSVPNLGAFQVTSRVSRDNFRAAFGGEPELDSQSKQIMQ